MPSPDDDDSSARASGGGFPLWWERDQTDLQRSRLRQQVRMIKDALEADGNVKIGIYPDTGDLADMEYMYRLGTVLTRDADAARVHDVLGLPFSYDKRTSGMADPISGLHPIRLPQGDDFMTVDVFDRLDKALGPGVATPEHVVHVTTSSGCPATEPEPATGAPIPAIRNPPANPHPVRVAVVDTGILPNVVAAHPSWLTGITGDPEQAVGHYRAHGTFVAGVVRTMAPSAQVHVSALLYKGGAILETDLANRLVVALQSNPDIISMSAGTTTRGGQALLSLQMFYENYLVYRKGTVLVCAAGNNGDRGPFYPASLGWPIAVGALDAQSARAGYSNYGAWVDVFARGSDVVNAFPAGPYTYQEDPLAGRTANFTAGMARWSGTSFSTPLVAGLIAARMSWTGENARQAWCCLARIAASNVRDGMWILEPGDADPGVQPPP